MTLFDTGIWMGALDGDARAFAIFSRHYSYYKYADCRRDVDGYRNRFLFLGPGEKMVLVTPNYDALFAWRKFINASGQKGVNCAVFRNESTLRASDMILAAEDVARRRWPQERFYTYVNPKRVKGSCPGYCFLRAKWKHAGMTKKGLLILEKTP